MLNRILLVDRGTQLVRAWQEAFRGIEGVETHEGDYFDHSADAMVSPANSFGFMDGGLDLAIRDALGTGGREARPTSDRGEASRRDAYRRRRDRSH